MKAITIHANGYKEIQEITGNPCLNGHGDFRKFSENVFKLDLLSLCREEFQKGWDQLHTEMISSEMETILKDNIKIALNQGIRSFDKKIYLVGFTSDIKSGVMFLSENPDDEFPWDLWGMKKEEIFDFIAESIVAHAMVGRSSLLLDELSHYHQIDSETVPASLVKRAADLSQECIEGIKHGLGEVIIEILHFNEILGDFRKDLNKEFAVWLAYLQIRSFSQGNFIWIMGDQILPRRIALPSGIEGVSLTATALGLTFNSRLLKSNFSRIVRQFQKIDKYSSIPSVENNFYNSEIIQKLPSSGLTIGAGMGDQIAYEMINIIFKTQTKVETRLKKLGIDPIEARKKALNDPEVKEAWMKWDERWSKRTRWIRTPEQANDFAVAMARAANKRNIINVLDNLARFLQPRLLGHIVGQLHEIKPDPTSTESFEILSMNPIKLKSGINGKMRIIVDSKREVGKKYQLQIEGLRIFENQIGRLVKLTEFVKDSDEEMSIDFRKENNGLLIHANKAMVKIQSFFNGKSRIAEVNRLDLSNFIMQNISK